jgi:hypothetical protein
MILAVAHWAVGGALFVERFETLDVDVVVGEETLRSGCVGSMFGVVETWDMGARGDPSNWYNWSMGPLTGSV